jgi:hypothetical protein
MSFITYRPRRLSGVYNACLGMAGKRTGGYEESFIGSVDKDLECPVCLLVMRQPLLTPCGHLLCTACADQLARDGEMKCPMEQNTFPRSEVY